MVDNLKITPTSFTLNNGLSFLTIKKNQVTKYNELSNAKNTLSGTLK